MGDQTGMRALVIGCGSIGRRHINNLLAMKEITNVVVCTKDARCVEDFRAEDKIELISSLEELDSLSSPRKKAFFDDVDFAIIANETYKHIDSAIFLAQRGLSLIIEKPISHNLEQINVLKEIAEQKGLKIFIAYNLRYLGAMKYIKKALDQKKLGTLYFAQIEVGQFLPSWRPAIDYRKCYSASSFQGGGVALDLSHEIDYMRYLFGNPSSWKVERSKVSSLEIESEDIFEGIYKFDTGFLCNIHMDYLQNVHKRQIRVVGSEGSLFGDLIRKRISIVSTDTRETVIEDEVLFDTDSTYKEELLSFIDVLKKNHEPTITLEDGVEVLRLLKDGNDQQK